MIYITQGHPHTIQPSRNANYQAIQWRDGVPFTVIDSSVNSNIVVPYLLPDNWIPNAVIRYTIFWTYSTIQTLRFRVNTSGLAGGQFTSNSSILTPWEIQKVSIDISDITLSYQNRFVQISTEQKFAFILGVMIEGVE